jgi:hypothetical protein
MYNIWGGTKKSIFLMVKMNSSADLNETGVSCVQMIFLVWLIIPQKNIF